MPLWNNFRTRKLYSRNQPCHKRDHSSKRDHNLSLRFSLKRTLSFRPSLEHSLSQSLLCSPTCHCFALTSSHSLSSPHKHKKTHSRFLFQAQTRQQSQTYPPTQVCARASTHTQTNPTYAHSVSRVQPQQFFLPCVREISPPFPFPLMRAGPLSLVPSQSLPVFPFCSIAT